MDLESETEWWMRCCNGDSELFEQFTDEIDEYFRVRFRYKGRCVTPSPPTMMIGRTNVGLYLRFKAGGLWPEDSIVIARIEFQPQRAGHGQALLEKLVELSGRYGYSSVGIEQAGRGESIQNFVRKFGFSKQQDSKNWLISVDALANRLDSLPERRVRRASGKSVYGGGNSLQIPMVDVVSVSKPETRTPDSDGMELPSRA